MTVLSESGETSVVATIYTRSRSIRSERYARTNDQFPLDVLGGAHWRPPSDLLIEGKYFPNVDLVPKIVLRAALGRILITNSYRL